MTGQTKKSDRDKLVRDFIKRCDPYKKRSVPKYDMRGYAAYLKKNGIQGKDVTPEILAMFAIQL